MNLQLGQVLRTSGTQTMRYARQVNIPTIHAPKLRLFANDIDKGSSCYCSLTGYKLFSSTIVLVIVRHLFATSLWCEGIERETNLCLLFHGRIERLPHPFLSQLHSAASLKQQQVHRIIARPLISECLVKSSRKCTCLPL
jgi:hypothetical protein